MAGRRHIANQCCHVANIGRATDGGTARKNAIGKACTSRMLSHSTHCRPCTDMQPAILYADIVQGPTANIHHFTHTDHVAWIDQQVGATGNNGRPSSASKATASSSVVGL